MAKKSRRRQQTPNNLKSLLGALDRQLKELAAGNATALVAAARAQQGVVYASQQRWAESADEFEQVAQLAIQEGDVAGEAMARYSQGVALFFLPERHIEAKEALERTVELAAQVEQRSPLAAKAHFILSAFRLAANNAPGALAELTAAIAQLDAESEPQFAAQLYQGRANLYLLQAQFDLASADLEQAMVAARRTGNQDLILDVQFDQRLVRHYSSGDGTVASIDNLFDSLQGLARKAGAKPLAKFVKLDRAFSYLQTGELKRAERLAQAVRQDALESADALRYTRYLTACLVISQVREQMGDKPGVLETLLTCKKTLELALSKEAGQLVVPFLDAAHERWGPEATQEALRVYQEQTLAAQ